MTDAAQTHPAPADQAPELPALPADGAGLRGALRRFASPVVVVTCAAPDGPHGATIGSFTSVSLAPPLVSFNVTHGTRLHDALRAAPSFAVHLLGAHQAEVAALFARSDLDGEAQLARVPHRLSPRGLPVVRDTLGVLLCRRHDAVEAGDHTLVIGRVEEILDAEAEGSPLLYLEGAYRGVGERA